MEPPNSSGSDTFSPFLAVPFPSPCPAAGWDCTSLSTIPVSPACPPARENYLFTCSCPKCLAQADDADVTSDEEEEGEGETDDAELEDEMTDV